MRKGNCPIILSAPHGGYKKPKKIPDKVKGYNIPDKNTLIIAKNIVSRLRQKDIQLYYIFSKIHRSKIDFNRPPRFEVTYRLDSKEARKLHSHYMKTLLAFAQESIHRFNKCLVIDFHGFTKPKQNYPDIIFGSVFGKTLNIPKKNPQLEDDRYWGLYQLKTTFSKHFTLDDGLALKNLYLAYSGGYITYQFCDIENINALQLELAKELRTQLNLTNIFISDFIDAIVQVLSQ